MEVDPTLFGSREYFQKLVDQIEQTKRDIATKQEMIDEMINTVPPTAPFWGNCVKRIEQMKREIVTKQGPLKEMMDEIYERFDFQERTMKFTAGLVMIKPKTQGKCKTCGTMKPWKSKRQFQLHKLRCEKKKSKKANSKKPNNQSKFDSNNKYNN